MDTAARTRSPPGDADSSLGTLARPARRGKGSARRRMCPVRRRRRAGRGPWRRARLRTRVQRDEERADHVVAAEEIAVEDHGYGDPLIRQPPDRGPCPCQRASAVSYTHLRAHETRHDLVCRLLLE